MALHGQSSTWPGHHEIGPIGTAARIAGGLAAIAVPIALDGITWWDLGAAFVLLPLTEIGGVPVYGQLSNVFRVRKGR